MSVILVNIVLTRLSVDCRLLSTEDIVSGVYKHVPSYLGLLVESYIAFGVNILFYLGLLLESYIAFGVDILFYHCFTPKSN